MFGSVISRLNDTRISRKVFIAPAIITAFMIGMAAISQYGSRQQSAALDIVANVAFAKSEVVAATQAMARTAHIDLFRMISWLGNSATGSADARASESKEAALRDVAQAAAALDKFAVSFDLSADEKQALDETRAALKAYAEAAKSVIELAEVEVGTGLSFMADADAKYAELDRRFETVQALEKGRGRAAVDEATGTTEKTTRLFLAMLLCAVALAVIVTLLVSRIIARPIVGMTDVMAKLSSGDKNATVPDVERRDEIGRMAQALLVFKESMLRAEQLAAERAREQRAKEVEAQRLEASTRRFDQNVGGVVRAVSAATVQLESSAHKMTATANDTNERATMVASASAAASSNVATVATAASELSSSIDEIARQVAVSNDIARQAVADTDRTNVAIEGLAEAAQRIGDVVRLINEIASQTNLLALNATIEAARAGDAGRGFQVVASEVKALANQTAKATDEIAAQVAAIQSATQASVKAMKGVSEISQRISDIAMAISSAVEQQGAATQEIARNIQQAAVGTDEVSSNIGRVTAAAGETGRAADEMLSSAREMARQNEMLRSEVDRFLAEVKAG